MKWSRDHSGGNMTTEEKVVAFDLLTLALSNRWHDGTYSASGAGLWDQPVRSSVDECIPDMLAWADRVIKARHKRAPS